MSRLIFIALLLALPGCGSLNTFNSAALTTTAQDYAGAKKNTQEVDDMKLRAWTDSACAINVGALQRIASSTGNPNAVNAVFMACPVPNVGVTSILPSGNMQVQTSQVPAPVK